MEVHVKLRAQFLPEKEFVKESVIEPPKINMV